MLCPHLRKDPPTLSEFTYFSSRDSYGIRHNNQAIASFAHRIPNFKLTCSLPNLRSELCVTFSAYFVGVLSLQKT